MNRKEATTKAAELLLTDKNRNANFYYSLFEKYSYLDTESIPISPIKMPNVAQENIVILSDEAYYNLMGIRDITDQTEEEVPFFILGEEKPDGKIYLDTVLSNNKPTGRGEADFSELNEILNIYVNNNGGFKIWLRL